MGSVLKQCCKDWLIPLDRVVAVVTDNGKNIVNAVKEVFGAEKSLPCLAHTINLIPQKAIEDAAGASALIQKVKAIVTFFKQSSLAADQLKEVQERNPDSAVLKLLQDVQTRWGSTYLMLARFVQIYADVGSALLKLEKASVEVPTASEMEQIKDIVKVLEPIHLVTTELCAEKLATLGKVIPLINCMKTYLASIKPDTVMGAEIKTNVLKEINFRFLNVEKNKLLAVGTVLDPRFKRLHFQSPLAAANAITWINHDISSLRGNSAEKSPSHASSAGPSGFSSALWQIHDKLSADAAKFNTENENSISELKLYLSSKTVERSDDPLIEWKKLSVSYPNLYKLAMKYSTVPATSVPSERVFSKTGAIMEQRRNRLTGSRLNKLLFLGSLESKEWDPEM